MIVLDTSTLIFWTLNQAKLSDRAQFALSQPEQKAISSISIWEIGIKVKQNKLEMPLPLQDYVDMITRIDGFEILPVDTQIWLKNIELEWDHRDPADRTIVATASLNASPLITSDHKIRAFYPQAVW